MEKRILVIGGSGLLGEPIAIHFKRNGFIVRFLVRDVEKTAKKFGTEFEIVEGDIKNVLRIETAYLLYGFPKLLVFRLM